MAANNEEYNGNNNNNLSDKTPTVPNRMYMPTLSKEDFDFQPSFADSDKTLNNEVNVKDEMSRGDADELLKTGSGAIEANNNETLLTENKDDVNKHGDLPDGKIQQRKASQKEEQLQEALAQKNAKGGNLNFKNSNNNNDCDSDNYQYNERTAYFGTTENRRNWKEEQGFYFNDEDYRMRFPWKRIAYIGVLLVLGITCATLALMKLCGGADWMNTATFSVIIMGTVMLLPPGLYYGRILICICFRCNEYTLWDVPAGPFG